MVFPIGASSLFAAVNSTSWHLRTELKRIQFSKLGLSLNPLSVNVTKNLIHNLNLRRGALAKRTAIVFWHDLVNNSISTQRSNNCIPCSITELLDLINCIKERLIVIVYCQRFGTQYIYEQLQSTSIPLFNVKRHLLSKRNRKATSLYKSLQKETHPDKELEVKHFLIVLRSKKNLQKLVQKRRSKNRKCKSKSRSKRKEKNPKSESFLDSLRMFFLLRAVFQSYPPYMASKKTRKRTALVSELHCYVDDLWTSKVCKNAFGQPDDKVFEYDRCATITK